MSRMPGANQSRRRPRQGAAEGGRSRARSIAPVVLLGTCMAAVLYGNATYYSDSFRQSHHPKESAAHSTPTLEGPQGGSSRESQPGGGVDTLGSGGSSTAAPPAAAAPAADNSTSSASEKKPLAEEEQLPEAPAAGDGGHGEGVAEGEGEGGVQDRWDDDDGDKGEENRGGQGAQSLTIGGATVEGLEERAQAEGAGGEGGEAFANTEQELATEEAGGGGAPVNAGGGTAEENSAELDESDQEANAGSREELDAYGNGGSESSERGQGEAAAPEEGGSSSGSAAGGADAEGSQERRGDGAEASEGEGRVGDGFVAGVSASRSSDTASAAASTSEGAAGSSGEGGGVEGAADAKVEGLLSSGISASRSGDTASAAAAASEGAAGSRGEVGGVEGATDAEVEGVPSSGREERVAASSSSTSGAAVDTNTQEEQPPQPEEEGPESNPAEQGQGPSSGESAPDIAREGLLQPGEGEAAQEEDKQEQQMSSAAPEGLLQPRGGDGGDAQQEGQQQDQTSENAAPEVILHPAVDGDAEDGGGDQANNGAIQGSMQCATTRLGEGVDNIVNIATWKDVPGDSDYRHPLAGENAGRYVTLQKDLGGFNNIRLSLETGVAFAAATGRTFVIPPPFTIWNMNSMVKKKEVDLRDLFSFDKLRDSGRVNIITTEEFLEIEAFTGGLGIQPAEAVKNLGVEAVTSYLVEVAGQYDGGLPELRVERAAFVMPRRVDGRVDLEDESYAFAKKWLYRRELLEYRGDWAQAKLIHWRANEARLLAPFYAFVLHADEVADRYHKRLLRDLMHYPEEVYCKASQIISLLREEDPSGEFSTFHVRRNDFVRAYGMVNIPMADVISNSLGHLKDNEVVYVATDEKKLKLFEPFHKHVRVKFMSDYYDRAGVSELNPNLLGMLDQVIASHGRTFTGCWLSTFTAYILRLRGHLQKPRTSNWSYYKPKASYHHQYRLPENPLWMTEWPLGWEGIDETGVPDPMAARR